MSGPDADVVVVGCGDAGLTAAITAHDAGARVVVLDKMPEAEAGGNSRVSGNLWFTPPTAEQAAVYLRGLCGDYVLPEPVVEAWAGEVVRNNEWVESLGGEIGFTPRPPEFPEVDGHGADQGDYHVGPGVGYSRLWLVLRDAAAERGIEIRYATPVQELVTTAGGRVAGVVAGGEAVAARRGVVLASGGFANNAQMARDYLRLPATHPWGSPASTGDGIRMAQAVGADLWHMDNFAGRVGFKPADMPAGFFVSFPSAQGFVYVADDGRRFMDESVGPRHGKIARGGRLEPFPDRVFHGVFDEATRLAGPIVNSFEKQPFTWNHIIEGYRWSEDNAAEIERGWLARGETPAELAAQIGVDPAGLTEQIEQYNRACAAGSDPQFGRRVETLVPLERPPYYAYTWAPLLIYTCGGPRKDERARVLDTTGAPIPGLYCAGEISSTYSWAMSGGMMIADALVFGRIAGRNVARENAAVAESIA